MSTITSIQSNDVVANSRAVINTNFDNLNTDKVESLGDLSVTVTASDINTVVGRNLTLPSGLVMVWTTGTAPTGWRLCDGSEISRTTYADLFTVIGTTYGAGNGTTTFNVPNLKGRVVVGFDSTQTEFDTLAETGGAKTHELTTAQLPAHNHGLGATIYGAGSASTRFSTTTSSNWDPVTATQNAGGGEAHNNLQPYMALNYIIKE